MGVAATIIGTLGAAYLTGSSVQAQAEAKAAQAEQNAKIQEYNADKADEAARIQDQNNKINEENQRRRSLLALGKQRAAIGASGITATGSAATALADTTEQINIESGMASYTNRQKVQKDLDASTEYTNYANMYKTQADNYRSLGQQSMTNAMLGGVLSLAGSLYSPKSAAHSEGSGEIASPTLNSTLPTGWESMGTGTVLKTSRSFGSGTGTWSSLGKWGGKG